jgi:hypothetical protein
MAGDWIKIEMETPDKPEVVNMAAILRMDQDAVTGKLFRIWTWADRNSIDGEAMPITCAFLDRLTTKRGFSAAMRQVGWLAGEDGNLTFPGFYRHNGITAKARAESNRRMANTRERRQFGCGNVALKEQPNPQPEKRKEEIDKVSLTQSERAHEIPTDGQVKSYAASAPVPISEACAVAFYDTQEASGWITKHGHSIADWRAALRRYASMWNENEKGKTPPGNKPEHRQAKAATEYPEPKTKLPRL